MIEQRRVQPSWDDDEDVQGHGNRFVGADAENPESDDTEGHGRGRWADAETAEGDDTEGHLGKWGADSEAVEGDDTEGHSSRVRLGANAESAEGDDVEGHVYIPAERDELNSQRLR